MSIAVRSLKARLPADARWRTASVVIMLAAWGLRVFGIADLRVFGDSASSVAFAAQPWAAIAGATAVDSHPPLYYYLLRLTLDTVGWTEIGARLPSIAAGILLVAVLMRTARRWGKWHGLAAGALAACSPVLVYYGRLPRMYALLALLATLVLILAARKGRPSLLVALSLAALMTHYLAVIPVGVAALLALVPERRSIERLVRAGWPFAVAVLLWIPWLAYALPASFAHTERTISGVPPPPTVAHFLGSLAVFAPVGTFVSLVPSVVLAIAAWVAIALSIRRGWPLAALSLTVGGAAALYLLFPAFGRPRFFIVLVPLVLLVVASNRRWYGAVALMVLAVVSLVPTFQIERGEYEIDAVRLAQALDGVSTPNDVAILQPWWQAGYLDLHLSSAPKTVDLRDIRVEQAESLIGSSQTVWLAMVNGTGRRDPAYPLEGWLDVRLYRVEEQQVGATRLVRYVRSTAPSAPVSANYPGLTLDITVPARSVAAGDGLATLLSWKPIGSAERLVAFLHLVDSQGRGWAGRDGEPLDGLATTSALTAKVEDRRGLVVPLETPPGVYRLEAGLYRRSDGGRVSGSLGDTIDLGAITVIPPRLVPTPLARLGPSLVLHSVALVRPPMPPVTVTSIQTVDGIQTTTDAFDAAPGDVIGVRTGWTTRSPLPSLTGYIHVLDASGRVVAQHDSLPAGGAFPTDRWPIGQMIYDRRDIALPKSLPAGSYQITIGWYGADQVPIGELSIGSLRIG